MKNMLKYTALAVLALTAVSSMAQQQGGGGGGRPGGQRGGGMQRMMRGAMMNSLSLVQRDDVREELAITDEQKDKISDLQKAQREKMREAFSGMGGGGTPPDPAAMRERFEKMTKESDAEVAKILTAEQAKRLREIKIQMVGTRSLAMDDVATDLGLSAEQKAKIKSLTGQADAANMTLFGKIRGGEMTMEQVGEAVETNGKTLDAALEKLFSVLRVGHNRSLWRSSWTAPWIPPSTKAFSAALADSRTGSL
ncbi:hypothetical protein EON79_20425 [bacterium]|nr:MAG: hypothetical protein EON79_20425 [bacterium]